MNYTTVLSSRVNQQDLSSHVTGSDRPKYFKKPLIPNINDENTQFSILGLFLNPTQQGWHIHESPEEPRTRTVEIQTMWRESEAQTGPYTPDYEVREGDNPEILTLAHLSSLNGLPATFDELEEIQIMREKKAFEHALPPTSDEASFQLRRRLMEEQEVRECKNREEEIIMQQDEKMELVKSTLKEREKDVEEKNVRRIDDVKIRKTEVKNRLIAKIQRKKIKFLRKVMKSKKEEEQPELKRDIIEEYYDFASRLYAAIAREGLSIDKLSTNYEVQPISLTTYQGVHDLTKAIEPSLLDTPVQMDKIIKGIQNYTKIEKDHMAKLSEISDRKSVKDISSAPDTKHLADDVKYRTPTPERPHGDKLRLREGYKAHVTAFQADEKKEKAVLFIQRLLRGRAIQNIMYEGKEKRFALIEELLTVANIRALQEGAIEGRLLETHQERLNDAILETIQGEVLARALDMLSKELVRLQEEKKAARLMMLAENDRRRREAEEVGRIQAEQILQMREDLLYREIVNVHQGTVDTFLDILFSNAVEAGSSGQAAQMSTLRREKIESQVESLENKHSKPQAVIKDLVASFLVPNIQKRKLQKKIAVEERRFAETAKRTLKSTLSKAK